MSESTNSDRAERREYIIGAYIAKYGGNRESVIQDIVSDLMHPNYRNDDDSYVDTAMTIAAMNFNCKISEEEEKEEGE